MYKHQRILIENGMVQLPLDEGKTLSRQTLVTILSNIAYYGYALSESAYARLTRTCESDVVEWWKSLEDTLKKVTGADKKMGDFVVYKNFPEEVLNMSEADYWFRQILMYWGFPNKYFTEDEKEREVEKENLPVKVLQPANPDSLVNIFDALLRSQVRWTRGQWKTVKEILNSLDKVVDVSSIEFKENMVTLASFLIKLGSKRVTVGSATDALRLAVGLSDGDVSLRTNSRLRKFSRPERKLILSMLDGCRNLEEDVARRREQFKRLFFALRPGDYSKRFQSVVAAYDKLYRNVHIKTFNSEIEKMLAEEDDGAIDLLKTRPGEFLRRLRVAVEKFGSEAVRAFRQVMPKLTVHQLLKIQRQVLTANDRKWRAFPPRGNWTKLQVCENNSRWDDALAVELADDLGKEISRRVSAIVPAINMSGDTEKVKLQTSDSDLTPYGRGTVFDIPEGATFLRSASYWKTGGTSHNIWYDNGWNFFSEDWSSLGSCCWTNTKYANDAAVFSGDPTNSKDLKGRACQMIDLYLDKLERMGVRYAVWNILCYSDKSFDEAEDVQAALQWGENPQKNKLFEPSRVALSFPVRGESMTKYIAYVDIKERKLIYIDANLYGNVSSAGRNNEVLAKTMPAFVEYVNALPSVADLFQGVPQDDGAMPVLYEDTNELIQEGPAYVFLQRNKHNRFDPFDLNSLLGK